MKNPISNFELIKVKENEKDVIYNLMQLYTYELSFFEDETTNFEILDNILMKNILEIILD